MDFFLRIPFKKTRIKVSFTTYIYAKSITSHTLAGFILLMYGLCLGQIPLRAIMNMLPIILLIVGTTLFVISPLASIFLSRDLNESLALLSSREDDQIFKRDLIRKLCAFPVIKAIEIFFIFLLDSVSVSYVITSYLHMDRLLASLVFYSIISGTYYHSILTFFTMDGVISKITPKIGFSEKNVKHYGIPNNIAIILSVIIPIFISMINIILILQLKNHAVLVYSNGLTWTVNLTELEKAGFIIKGSIDNSIIIKAIIICSITNIIFTFTLITLYYNRIYNYTKELNSALSTLDNIDVENKRFFKVDYTNEHSLLLNLLNNIIMMLNNIIGQNYISNEKIKESSDSLYSIATQTKEISNDQSVYITDVLDLMNSINSILAQIQIKTDEVINVAKKTDNEIDLIFHNLSQNLIKMHEMNSANNTTIASLSELSGKVSNIQEIISIIDSVAEQTKTIAFTSELAANEKDSSSNNFTSVAEQIRSLTTTIIDLTSQIKVEIYNIKVTNEKLIELGNTSTKKIAEETELSSEIEQNFKDIKESATLTSLYSKQIKDSIIEQEDSYYQIETALEQINESINNFTQSSSEINKIIGSLKENSKEINSLKLQKDN